MEQLLLHLFGDYISQTEWMAKEKSEKSRVAIVHAIIYTIPFLLITQSVYALAVICCTHFFIDRYRLARYLIFFKNKLTDWGGYLGKIVKIQDFIKTHRLGWRFG